MKLQRVVHSAPVSKLDPILRVILASAKTNIEITTTMEVNCLANLVQPRLVFLTQLPNIFGKNFALPESHSCGEFPQPKDAKDDDGQRIDGILVLTPPTIILDNLGRSVAVILLDVWNFVES